MAAMNKDDRQSPGHKADFAIVRVFKSRRQIIIDTHIDHAAKFATLGPLTLYSDNSGGPVRFGHDGQYVRIMIDVAATMDFHEALQYVQDEQDASAESFRALGKKFDIWREDEPDVETKAKTLAEVFQSGNDGKTGRFTAHYTPNEEDPDKPGQITFKPYEPEEGGEDPED